MFTGLKLKIAGMGITSFLKSLATDKDTQTSITGILAGAILAIPGLEWDQVLAGDPYQIAKLVSGVLVAGIGILATKENADGKATLLGVVSGAAYASQGSIEQITTGIVIAVLGYLTNKPVTTTAVSKSTTAGK